MSVGKPSPDAQFDPTLGVLVGQPLVTYADGELKTIMTDIGKNKRNRAGDLNLHARDVAYNLGRKVVTFGVCVVNASDGYYSPTAGAWKKESNGIAEATKGVRELRSTVKIRQDESADGLDAVWAPVIVADNDPDADDRTADWLAGHPMPPDGDVLSYPVFIERVAQAIANRYP